MLVASGMDDSQPTIASLLVDWIEVQIKLHPGIPVLFVSGAQGIGKSTALHAVAERFAGRVAALSIDDFYQPQSDRKALASKISPLFEVRGPPGTHDLALLKLTIDALLVAGDADETSIPVFDKTVDDRVDEADWAVFQGRPKAILLEGWCVGALPDPAAPQAPALNTIESRDASGAWRAYQEQHLAGPYADLWDRADAFLHLSAPGFEQVLAWRTQQEETTLGLDRGQLPSERRAWVADFIQHYERITHRLLDGGQRRGYQIKVNADRSVRNPPKPAPPLLVFSDLDGTLLDHHTYSFDAASEALNALRELGAVLVLSSSKTAAEISPLRAELGFEHCPAIVENGGGILEPRERVEPQGAAPHVEIRAALAAAPADLQEHFAGFSDWSVAEVAARTGLSHKAAARAKQRQFSEPGLWTGPSEMLTRFKAHLARSGIFAQRGGRFLTLSHGMTKADQMFEIASRYAPAPMIALGDAPNDLEMISSAHRGVIIKNANGPKIERTAGEATGKTVRSVEIGPAGWNRAILEFIAQLE